MVESTRTGAVNVGATVGAADPIAEAAAREVSVVQISLGDLRSFKGPEIAYPGGASALATDAAAAGIAIYVHAPYIINVASTNNRLRIPSRKLLQQHLDASAEIGAAGLVVHGGNVSAEDDPAIGFDNWRKAIEAVDLKVPLLIENTAGGEHSMARRLDRIAATWEAVQQATGAENVGFCLDTCHAWAGGLALETVVDDILAITGRIDLVHANDSRDAANSGADRHANLGQGQIPPDLLAQVIATAGAPAVLETPGDAAAHRADIAWLQARWS